MKDMASDENYPKEVELAIAEKHKAAARSAVMAFIKLRTAKTGERYHGTH